MQWCNAVHNLCVSLWVHLQSLLLPWPVVYAAARAAAEEAKAANAKALQAKSLAAQEQQRRDEELMQQTIR